ELLPGAFRFIGAPFSARQDDIGQITIRAPSVAGTTDLEVGINQFWKTCTHCVFATKQDGTMLFPRWGRLTVTRAPTGVGDQVEGYLYYQLEEVAMVNGELVSSSDAPCVEGRVAFHGMAVAGGIVASGMNPTTPEGGDIGFRPPDDTGLG